MTDPNIQGMKEQYDGCIQKVNDFANLLKQLTNQHDLEKLEEQVIPEDYLTLLANSLYAINSLSFVYSNMKQVEMPPQFSKVKQYFNKAKNPLVTVEKQAPKNSKVNKEVAQRMIQRSIK